MNKEELARLVSIMLLMTETEVRYFLFHLRSRNRRNRQYIKQLASALEIKTTSRSDYTVIRQIGAHIKELRESDQEPPTFDCINCGGTTEAKGLRWDKLNKGEAVTVSVDHSGKPASLNWLTSQEILSEWFQPWTVGNPNIKFQLVTGRKGDCHVTWEAVDGPGNTLKYVWQPRDGEFMEQGGTLVGDLISDNSEVRFSRVLEHEAGKHEVGHVLGIGHLSAQKDVMYPTARGQNKPLSNNDLRERDERYPI